MKKHMVLVKLFCLFACLQSAAFGNELKYCAEGVPHEIKNPLHSNWWGKEIFVKPVMESLVEIDSKTKEVGPMLADEWQVNSDQTEFTISLRKDVKFHSLNGKGAKEFEADDVLSTFNSLFENNQLGEAEIRERIKARGFNSLSQLSKLEKLDSYTVRFRFDSPQPTFLSELSNPALSIQSSQYLELLRQGRKDVLPVGTGQWKVSEFEPSVGVKYEAFTEHWRGNAPFNSMKVQGITDPYARANGLASGDCDVIYLHPNQRNLLDAVAGEITILPDQFIAANKNLLCYGADSKLGNLASVCLPNAANLSSKDQCPKCPKSGACPQSVLAARQQCCPKSGSCGQ